MIQRYGTNEKGQRVPIASIYTAGEHPIKKNMISPQALQVIDTLRGAGYRAYIVGGAVRDLLAGKKPKDFDVATDALPNRIRKIFPNAWIIGKRFKLAHVIFPDRYIIEVATFRSVSSGNFNAVYGTIEEDVRRRDFTVNALFFDPEKEQLIDYVGGANVGDSSNPKWGYDGNEVVANKAIFVESEQGLDFEIPNGDIEAVINADMSAAGIFLVDFTVTPMAVTAGKAIRGVPKAKE